MNPFNFTLLFFAFCSFLISILIWLKREDEIGARYFIFSTLVSVWGVGVAVMLSSNASYATALHFGRLAEMAAVFIPVTWLHFVAVYTGTFERFKAVIRVLYGVAVFVDLFGFSPLFIWTVKEALGFIHYFRPGPIFHLYTTMYVVVVPMGFIALFNKLSMTHGAERSHLKGFIFCTLTAYVGASLTFLPMYEIMLPQYGLFLLPVYPFCMAYFMIRKNLFSEQDLVQAAHQNKLAAIGTLAASINHEIKSPLYVIQGLAQSYLANRQQGLYSEAIPQQIDDAFRKTETQAQKAIDIMKRFLMFSKVTKEENQEAVDLAKVWGNVLPLIGHELEMRKVQLSVNIPSDLPKVRADSHQLEEIFFNLVLNACQAVKQSEGVIEVNAKAVSGRIAVVISDNGPGIPKDKLRKIFEPFYTTKNEGTGLGLYISQQLAQKNNGRISVESNENGTNFLVEFSS